MEKFTFFGNQRRNCCWQSHRPIREFGCRNSNSNGHYASPNAYDVVLANLPYVPSYYRINEAAGREPRVAIFGGGDGLEVYRRLFTQLANSYNKPQFVLTEAMPPQHARLADIAASAGFCSWVW